MDFIRPQISFRSGKRTRGISLVEVMIAATIFTMLSVSATALFIQNQRAAVTLRYSTQATNTALNMLEQLRLKTYAEIKELRDQAVASPTTDHIAVIFIADPQFGIPTAPSPYAPPFDLPQGTRPVELQLNVVDGGVINRNWTHVSLPMESGANTVSLETRYWLTITLNESLTTPIVQAAEITLVYQWKNPRQTEWQSSTVRLVVVNPSAL